MPTLSDALCVHSQAHETQCVELHDVALKMLALSGQTHICTDGLDEQVDETVLDAVPGAVCLDSEAAALLPPPYGKDWATAVVTDSKELVAGLSGKLPNNTGAVYEGYYQHKERVPAYELYLVRKAEAETVVPECPFTIGDYVTVGHPRSQGAYRFPIVAQKVSDGYVMLQVHKDGDSVKVFGKDGKQPKGMAGVIDLFVGMDKPESGIFECILQDGKVSFWDVLVLDGVDCTKLPLSERQEMVAEYCRQDDGMAGIGLTTEWQKVPRQDGLAKLEAGTWLVRYAEEVLGDLSRPFWWEYAAGTVKVGVVLPWVKPSGTVADASGMITVQDTGLPMLQIHKSSRGVAIYMAEGGRNRSGNLPQIVEMAKRLPENFIMEAMFTATDGGVPVSADRVQDPKSDLSMCDVKCYPFDVVLYGDEDLSKKPMYERVEVLESLMEDYQTDNFKREWDGELGKVICFTADSERPINGDCSHCFSNTP